MTQHVTGSSGDGAAAVVTRAGAFADRDAFTIKGRCSIERALDLIGTHSAIMLLREAFLGSRRFDDLTRRAGLTDAVAAKRLKQLVEGGLLTQRPYQVPGSRTRYEYVLTERGRSLFPVIVALTRWGDELDSGPGPVDFVHADCGARVLPAVHCTAGHEVSADETQAWLTSESGAKSSAEA